MMHLASATEVYAQQTDQEEGDIEENGEFQNTFRGIKGDQVAPIYFQPIPKLYFITLPAEEIYIETRNDGGFYVEKRIEGYRSGFPVSVSFPKYADMNRERVKQENWQQLIRETNRRDETQRGIFDMSVDIPGGRESAFSSIFGSPEVNLRVNGVATMNVGASVQRSEDPSLPPDQQTRIDPTFDQSLQLNIQGNIGDKLTIQTDWDTERQFDYQNRLSISYEGYEDEIIKSIEMGNVNMNTGNSLIRGSGALFGIKSVAELGSFRLTSIISQQDGESNVETISGGSQEQPIQLRPADYSDDRHFFLDYYTRQEFENSMANPQQLSQTLQIADVEVWVLRENIQSDEGARLAVALADLGVVRDGTEGFLPPENDQDVFDAALLDQFRDPQTGVSPEDLGVTDSRNFEEGYFTPLEEGTDYTINKISGYISLRRGLGSREVLAISFTYRGSNNEIINVGELNRSGNDRIFLKMLRPQNVSTDSDLFNLTMRNIYSLGVSDINRESLELELEFTEQNIARDRLPGRSATLLQDLGLDRVDSQGALEPDNQLDFGTGTLDPQNGLVIFPYLEPFGNRIREVLQDSPASEEEIERLSYDELYEERNRNASQSSKNGFYRFSGTSRGGLQENYNLGFALVEGSVRVYANGNQLQENVDYQVDYSFGSITILNDRYTAPGQDIRIEYENQALTSIEQKTFTGLRAEYDITNNFQVGGTFFRFNERPLDDKIRIGDEPISNSVIGLDANARFDTPFLTRAVDWLPLIQTRENSEFEFSGEFAQLRPGVSETRAVRRAIRNNELFEDEEEGLSFVDDFEGSNIKINLLNATRWNLAAAPAAVPGYEPDESIFLEEDFPGAPVSDQQSRLDRSDLRSKLSWYSIPRNISTILGNVDFTPESQPVEVTDVFPGRETQNPQEEIITTLDVFYDPTSRGQYNYNSELRTLLEDEPERTWGGMTAVIPSGQEDFSQNNIEFLEFWVQPVLEDGQPAQTGTIDDFDGKIYIDVGLVTEDVVPNSKLNTEDGLALNPETLILDSQMNPRSALPANPPPPEGQFSNENREIEDVGLDGMPNSGGVNGLNEQTIFEEFVDQMRVQWGAGSEEFEQISSDPSNDDYIFYGESLVQDLPLHERFHRMLGHGDGNTPIDQSERRASTNRPNTEGLVNPSTVALNNSYFQYEVELNPADENRLEIGSPGTYIVDRVPGSRQQDRWYQVRIPLDEFKRTVGDINDFQNITYIRIWMSGYEQPFTLRFASLEFVGSQWRQDENINSQSDPNADIKISTINIEENSNRRPIPYRQPRGAIRAQNRGTQLQSLQNEQSIVLQGENIGPGSLQLVKRVYPGGLNLLNYSNMRMFVHGEGYEERGEAELVMRFGNDLENNYYEYRQPVTPSNPNFPYQEFDPGGNQLIDEEAEQVWRYDENSMNIVLSAFNQLKQLRDQEGGGSLSEVYERSDILEDAVPGAVVAIKGNPSLGRVSEVGMGIRNPFDPDNPSGPGTPILNAELWLNELRVSGFDNETGWAANAKSSLKIADFATLNANLIRQTQGFGSLDSRLGQRRVSNEIAYDLSTTVNLDSFIPERYGWNIPVSLSTRRSNSVPKYLPNQGDVRLTDFEQAVRSRTDLNEDEQDQLIEQQIRDVETYSESYSVNLSNLSKQNSQNWLARYTLDNTTFNYVYNTTDGRTPEYLFQDNWNYNASVRYNHNFRTARYVRPFNLLSNIPLAGTLAGLQLGITPTNFSSSLSTRRSYEERKRRTLQNQQEFALQQTHSFTYTSNLGFGYNLTPSVSTSFQSQSIFDLGRASIKDAGLTGVDSDAFETESSFDVFRDLIFDDLSPRRSSYSENYTASWQPRLSQISVLNWLNYNARYSGGYRWENSPFGSNQGSRVSNTFRLDHTLRVNTETLLNKIPFYENAVEADRDESREREISRDSDEESAGYTFGEQFSYYARKTFLAVFSLRSADINYSSSKTGSQAGYDGGSSFFDMFGGDNFTPSFGYRIGIEERIRQDRLISNPDGTGSIQIPANNTYSDNITLGTRLNPFTNLSIDLSWQTQWDERRTESISLSANNEISSVVSSSGNISSSIWAFGSGYEKLFRNQLQSAFDGMSSVDNVIGADNGNTVLNSVALQEDFRKAYMGRAPTIGDKNFTPIPLPNWRINWTGIEEIFPWIGRYMQRATITHSYSGLYRVGWNLNNDADTPISRRLGIYQIEDTRPEFDPSSVNIEKRFAPLVQLNITWDNGLRTQMGYETSKLTSLSLSNTQVSERTSKGVRVQFAYTLRNFRLPFFRRLTNNVDLTLNGNYIEDSEQRFLLDADLERALQVDATQINRDPDAYDFNPRPPTGQTRINTSAVVGYRFSNTIQANFEYGFTQILPKSSRTFKRTTHDIRFNIRINIRSS
ncbi:cell surface protein SprA [Rhodohalobacter barkolensis]|uniref:Cell surface protein SprA n=1 Tax=Rhodohalobacter barkolensis TaxID=2053187 RepID=A0A2N0VJ50_9BACT|nr:cell surface protein SprA [Rhodohalobacter barkolensis]PKD44225.1 cell surface protein SprA [Rhodohalobacter barkolensis]